METIEKEYFKATVDDIVYISSILGNEITYTYQELQDVITQMQQVAEKRSYNFDSYPSNFNNW